MKKLTFLAILLLSLAGTAQSQHQYMRNKFNFLDTTFFGYGSGGMMGSGYSWIYNGILYNGGRSFQYWAGHFPDTMATIRDIREFIQGGGLWKKENGKISPLNPSDTIAMLYAELDSLKDNLAKLQKAFLDSLNARSASLGNLSIGGSGWSGAWDANGGTAAYNAGLGYNGNQNGKFLLPNGDGWGGSWGSGFSGYLASTNGNNRLRSDTLSFMNPNNNTYVNVINGTSLSDTTIDILGLGGGQQIGVAVTYANVTNTDGVLTTDAYLIASIGGTLDHDFAQGSLWAGYLDLLFTAGTGAGANISFTLPDPGWTICDLSIDYFTNPGTGSVLLHPVTSIQNYTSNASNALSFGTAAFNYTVRINFWLDNRYGYTGNFKLNWSCPSAGNSTTLLRGSTLVAYRIE